MNAIDTDQTDAPQDERRNTGWEVHPLGEACRCDGGAIAQACTDIDEGMAPDAINGTCPAFFAKWLSGRIKVRTGQYLGGPNRTQPVGLIRFAGDCDHPMPRLCQQGDRDAANTTAGTRDQYLARAWFHSVASQRLGAYLDAEGGGVPSGTDCHGATGVDRVRQCYEPVGGYARALGEAARMGFAHAPAVQDDCLTWLEPWVAARFNLAREINASNERELADDWLSGQGERILVVHG